MNSHSHFARKVLVKCCGVGLAVGLLAFVAQGDPWDKKTTLTVNQTIQVSDRVLPAGTYVFKLADSSSNRHIVQIFDRDQRHIIDTILAIPNYRLRPTGKSQFMFWETPQGAAPALRAWFYPGDNFGQEFRYPKNLAMVKTEEHTEQTRIMNREAETNTETKTEEAAPAPAPAPEPQMTEAAPPPPPAEEPVQMAQNTPPPAPPAAEPTPAPEPQRLPKTASPYPWIGLAGIFSLSLYGLLRLQRSA